MLLCYYKNSTLSLSLYHAEQETPSLGELDVSVFLWCKVKDNSFLSITFTGAAFYFAKEKFLLQVPLTHAE